MGMVDSWLWWIPGNHPWSVVQETATTYWILPDRQTSAKLATRFTHLWIIFGTSDSRVKKKLLRVGLEIIQVEAGSVSYLLRVKSKLGSGQVLIYNKMEKHTKSRFLYFFFL